MIPLDRQPLSHQVACRLLDEIRGGRWQTRLPGYRDLGTLFGVSRTTIETALDHLTRQGVLLAPNGRGGRRIVREFSQSPATRSRRVVIVGSSTLPRLWPFTSAVVDETINRLNRRGYETDYVSFPALLQPRPDAAMDDLLGKNPDCLWIFVKPLHAAVRWAASSGVTCVLLGGEVRGCVALPCVGSPMSPLFADATRRLIALGHREIILCVGDLGEHGRAAAIQQVRPIFEKSGIPFHPSRNVPLFVSDVPRDFIRVLGQLFAATPPTAIVVNWIGEVLALTSFCNLHGIRIPRDLSVIVAKLDEPSAWHAPPLTGYRLSTEAYVTHLERWVANGGSGLPPGITLLSSDFVEGSTLHAPPTILA